MWPFRKKPKGLAPGKKLCLIAVKDYPKEAYSAYWEIGISAEAPFYWFANFLDYGPGSEILRGSKGVAESEDAARRASQEYVLSLIETYRRRIV